MKKNSLLILLVFLFSSCTFRPLPMGGEEMHQEVNHSLVNAKRIVILAISINGVKPPKESFDYSMGIIKKYTTDNIEFRPTIELTMEDKFINPFIVALGRTKQVQYLFSKAQSEALEDALRGLPERGNAIVMVYTPTLLNPNTEKQLRGYAFESPVKFNVVAYNGTTINAAPVISDVQSWKIVLTHEIGHRLGVPASVTHNKAGHCNNRECVMYARPDLLAVLSVLLHGMPYDFCDDCKLELKEAKKYSGVVYNSGPY